MGTASQEWTRWGKPHGRARIAIVATAAALLGALLPACADAGTYTVTGCRIGWVPEALITTSQARSTFDLCDLPNDPGLYAGLGGSSSVNASDYVGGGLMPRLTRPLRH